MHIVSTVYACILYRICIYSLQYMHEVSTRVCINYPQKKAFILRSHMINHRNLIKSVSFLQHFLNYIVYMLCVLQKFANIAPSNY